jgi:HSP20 family protein
MTGTAEGVEVKKSETPEKTKEIIFDELRCDFADWLTAKEDLVWRPPVELTEEGNEFAVRALVPGVDPRDVEVLVAPDILLIKGETSGKRARGTVHRYEPDRRKILRSIEFPRAINPGKVHAEIEDGMLSIKAEIAKAERPTIVMPRAA